MDGITGSGDGFAARRRGAATSEEDAVLDVTSGFAARRPAAGGLPAFSLPPPSSEIPRASDALSPCLSSVNTGSSQSSQAHGNAGYIYGSVVHNNWSSQTNGYHHVGSPSPDHNYGTNGTSNYGTSRSSVYSQPSMNFANPRSSQSPAASHESLSHFSGVFHSGGRRDHGANGHHLSGSAPATATHHESMLGSSQAHPTPTLPATVDGYGHSRTQGSTSYYPPTSTAQQQAFSPYGVTHQQQQQQQQQQQHHQQQQQQPSPPSGSPRSRFMAQFSPMAPPAAAANPYRYNAFQQPAGALNGPGPIMSNIHQPGTQLTIIPGLGGGATSYASQPMYAHQAHQQVQTERPFKCEQCVQSFSRNHDLKRHKRIHLSVKPFPCTYCTKSFSRKDALKRHRLVKGCEAKSKRENDGKSPDQGGDGQDDGSHMSGMSGSGPATT